MSKYAPTRQGVPTIAQFVGSLALGLDFIEKAGTQLVAMKKDDFDVFDRIMEECDWLTKDMLECIHNVGMKVLHPKLLLMPKHVYDHVCGLPMAEQEKVVTLPVAVPPPTQEGRPVGNTVFKPAAELNRSEADRVWQRRETPVVPFTKSIKYLLTTKLGEGTVTLLPGAVNARVQTILLDKDGTATVQFKLPV